MLGRLLSLIAALMLATAPASAYAPEPEIARPALLAAGLKTAPRGVEPEAEHAAKEKSGASVCRVWEIWFPPLKLTSSMGYTGYYADAESGQYYAQQRYYRQGIGRFLRADPGPMFYERPITLNRYLYANGNPLIYVDPDGRIALLRDLGATFGGWGEQSLAYADQARSSGSRVGWLAGGAGYLASLAGEAVVGGANLGANAVSIAAAEAGAALGSDNVFTPLAAEARGEIDELVEAGAPIVDAIRADAAGTAKAAAIGVVTGIRDEVVAAARGDSRAQFELAGNISPARLLKNFGGAVLNVVEPPKRGAPVTVTIGEGVEGAPAAIEQRRDALGRFLPRDGSELQPGGAFETRVGEMLRETNSDVSRQVRIQAPDGTVTILDYASRGPDGRLKLTEAKGSQTAALTSNQRKAIPQIQQTGGVVVGRGTDQFPAGSVIPPTPVRVVRPETMERLERMRRGREEQGQ